MEQWRIITKQKQANIFVIDFSLFDTRKKENDLTSTFVADLVLQILSYVAQTKREFIHRRQAKGIASAKKRDVKFDREPIDLPVSFENAKRRHQAREMSVRQAAEYCGMSTFSLYRKVNNL